MANTSATRQHSSGWPCWWNVASATPEQLRIITHNREQWASVSDLCGFLRRVASELESPDMELPVSVVLQLLALGIDNRARDLQDEQVRTRTRT